MIVRYAAAVVNPLHEHHDPAHLEHVIAEMKHRGAPHLRASWDGVARLWHAREGTHRLRAALALGLVPVLLPVPWRRSEPARQRARFAALESAHTFPFVDVLAGAVPWDCWFTPAAEKAHRP